MRYILSKTFSLLKYFSARNFGCVGHDGREYYPYAPYGWSVPGSAGDSEASARLREGVRPGVTAVGGRIVGDPMPEVVSSLEF